MICHQILGPGGRPLGTYLAPGFRASHGLCRTCAPAHCRDCGLSEQDTARILSTYDPQPSTP